ncbi:MAG: M48 family metalloprotease [Actinomycetota bacterium]|nr:M48 family metalloprotease [Actinomycetota bacterium]
MSNNLKTVALLGFLGALFVVAGAYFGRGGMLLGLGLAVALNVGAYFFSDKLALRAARAKPVDEHQLPEVYSIVRSLAQRQGLPMPRIYLIESPQPNAFATGRDPEHAAVAVTSGILQLMERPELEAVLAHELAHVRNRDILISSVAATLAAALVFLSRMALWGGLGGDRRRGSDPLTAIIGLASLVLAPLAAMVIRMAISRSREFQADASGAAVTGSPLQLAGALGKLDGYTSRIPMKVDPAVSQLFIADPLKALRGGQGFSKVFSTHPPMEERVARLREMAAEGRR